MPKKDKSTIGTGSEVTKSAVRTLRAKQRRRRWGRWHLEKDLVLAHKEPRYYIDLETMNSSAEMLDMIFQVNKKSWRKPSDISNLIQAFDDILDPQAHLCSYGTNRKFDASSYLRRLYGFSRVE